jgi:hypothetical protein
VIELRLDLRRVGLDQLERGLELGDHPIDHRLVHRRRDDPHAPGREEDAAVQHLPVQDRGEVAALEEAEHHVLGVPELASRPDRPDQRAKAPGPAPDPDPVHRRLEATAQPFPEPVHPVDLLLVVHLHRDQPRGQGVVVAAEGAGVRDRFRVVGIEASHDLGPSAEGAHRIASADQLAERRQIRPHPFDLLEAAAAQAEGDDLVEDQQHAVAVGELPHAAQVSGLGLDQPARAQHRLHDDPGDPLVVLSQDRLGRLEVVERGDVEILGDAARHPALQANRGEPRGHEVGDRVRLDEVVDAVIPAVHLDEAVLAGEGPGGAHREKRGLGPRVAVANQVERGDAVAEMSGVLVLDDRRRGEGRALLRLGARRLDQPRVGVSVDQRGEVVDQIDVLVPVAIGDAASLALLHEDGIGTVVAGGARVSAGQVLLRRLEVLPGLRGPLEVALQDLLLDALPAPGSHRDPSF